MKAMNSIQQHYFTSCLFFHLIFFFFTLTRNYIREGLNLIVYFRLITFLVSPIFSLFLTLIFPPNLFLALHSLPTYIFVYLQKKKENDKDNQFL